jgi:hypothetical protein
MNIQEYTEKINKVCEQIEVIKSKEYIMDYDEKTKVINGLENMKSIYDDVFLVTESNRKEVKAGVSFSLDTRQDAQQVGRRLKTLGEQIINCGIKKTTDKNATKDIYEMMLLCQEISYDDINNHIKEKLSESEYLKHATSEWIKIENKILRSGYINIGYFIHGPCGFDEIPDKARNNCILIHRQNIHKYKGRFHQYSNFNNALKLLNSKGSINEQ